MPATCTAASASRSNAVQRRFSDGTADGWAERVGELDATAPTVHGSAPRSTASAPSIRNRSRAVAAWARRARAAPLHAHVSEQPAENEAVRGGLRLHARPQLLAEAGALGRALHRGARHPPHRPRHRSCSARPAACAASARRPSATWPTASARPGALRRRRRRARARHRLARGDRSVRGGARGRARRAAGQRRARHAIGAPALLEAATATGHACLGWPEAGRIAPGRWPTSSRSASTPSAWRARRRRALLDAARVRRRPPPTSSDVIVGGRDDRRATAAHVDLDVAGRAARVDRGGAGDDHASSIDRIGLLVTNDPRARRGPARHRPRRRAGDRGRRVVAVEPAGAVADERARRRRALRDPRLRRQPHPPRLRRRSRRTSSRPGWPARPYEAGGIRVTTDGDPRGDRGRAAAPGVGPPAEARRAPGITHVEIKSGYGLDASSRGSACCQRRRRAHRRRHLPRRPRRPGRVRRARRRLRRSRLRRDARRPAAARPLDRRVLRAGRVRRRAVARGAGGGPRRRARAARPRQPARARARRRGSPSSSGAASVDHCTYLADADIEALAASETVATFLPATDFSTRQPYPDARRAIDAGVSVALATNMQPGLELHDLDVASASRWRCASMGMTVDEALCGGDAGRRAGAAPRRHRSPGARRPGRRGHPGRPLLRPSRLPAGRAARALGAAGR